MIKHIFRISFGIVLIIIGIIGIFLPFIPGLLLILLGSAVIVEKNPKILFSEIAEKVNPVTPRKRRGFSGCNGVKRKMRAKQDEKAG